MNAVNAHAERTAALVLVEGIEDDAANVPAAAAQRCASWVV